ncbi:sensor domain-containing protein [Mycobacterium sp. 852002-50816_SCH5313054-b]|uniref:sensor domain-containing protein n=1 Tax=Mycobacterium sp. 852002-50816_SCH5313054-b TaxID=1834092 RepID=UPI000B0AE005|nr:sensor domain-containing protein [Mycobacterium sp. 852002-50816_SCH5313054-b]
MWHGARSAWAWRLLLCVCGAVLLTACTRVVGGAALPGFGPAAKGVHGVNVDTILLDQPRMRAITGAGEHLTIIPSMDGSRPVDIDALADTTPAECRFLYAETATFGPDIEEFHKTTFQDPPDGALISEGAAAYPDADTARRAFGALVTAVGNCAGGSSGQLLVGDWTANANSLHLGPGGCGRDYRVLSVAMVEVTFCGFAQSVSDIVMTNIAANVPG